jgi:hypothetical protein
MRTERDKMLAGELYDALDPALVVDRYRVRDLCQRLNASFPSVRRCLPVAPTVQHAGHERQETRSYVHPEGTRETGDRIQAAAPSAHI